MAPHRNKRNLLSACSARAIKCIPFMTIVLFIAAISLPTLLLLISPLIGDIYKGHLFGSFAPPQQRQIFP